MADKRKSRTKSRDPNVTAMTKRKSGPHGKSTKALRREDNKQIKAELGYSRVGLSPKY